MTIEPEDRKSLSEIRMESAREFIEDAGANLNDGRFKNMGLRSLIRVSGRK